MIKKLRQRFILVNMLMLLAFLIGILAAVFVSMYNSEINQSKEILKMVLQDNNGSMPNDQKIHEFESNNESGTPETDIPKPPSNEKFTETEAETDENGIVVSAAKRKGRYESGGPTSSDALYVTLDMNRNITEIMYYSTITDDVYNSIFEAVGNLSATDSTAGIVKTDYTEYRYMMTKGFETYHLALVSRSSETSTVKRLLLTDSVIFIMGFFAILAISMSLAKWMIKPIQTAWENEKQFIANASHELKTPLTVISANMDVIMSNPDDMVKNQNKWMTYITDEIKRMSKLITDLLYIAKSDAGTDGITMCEFNISDVVSGTCLVFESLVFEKGKTLEYNIEPDILYTGDEDKIKQLVSILLDNAVKHSYDKSEINVTLEKDKQHIKLMVENEGDGIPKDDIQKIFDRFYRVDSSRDRNTGGYGLGLNIAETIVSKHKGKISVQSVPNEKTCFIIIL